MKTKKEIYREKMESQLKQWGARRAVLQARATQVGAEAKTEFRAMLSELKELELASRRHLALAETSVATSWERVKGDLSDRWDHVSGAAEAIWARVRPTKELSKRAIAAKPSAARSTRLRPAPRSA